MTRSFLASTAALALMAGAAGAETPETAPTMTEAAAAQTAPDPAAAPEDAGDAYLWLEAIEGEAALDWVRQQNERTLDALTGDPRHAGNEAVALEIANSDARIPYGSVRDGMVYNFWQDENHVRGLWRRTPLDSYRTDAPDWETVLDFDALAEAEDANWVFKGADCLTPVDGPANACLVALSDGGKDATELREFDLASKAFVEGGFVTPQAKQDAEWVDGDTVLIGTDWGGDGSSLTASGYPSIVKRWRRGTPLEDAETVFAGEASDVATSPFILELDDGTRLQNVVEADTFFTFKYWWLPDGEADAVQWPVPPKSSLTGVYKGRMLVSLKQDWAPEGASDGFRSGDLVAFDLDTFLQTRTLPEVTLVFRPNERQAINRVAISKSAALLSINDNVVGRILRLEPGEAGWTTQPLALPGQGQAGIAFASRHAEEVFLSYEGFLTPDSLLEWSAASGNVSDLKNLPAWFDADGMTVQQFSAISKDGTEVPYFVVHREDITLDGTTPALMYGYGGFQVTISPSYDGIRGKLWLEQGGAYILANIRGGGEFGPEWHQAGLKQNRQAIYDDFIAVAEDAIAKGITAPDKLGILGYSNGGLLMGVMLNQRPDLWNAVIVAVPLLDMLRYHLLLAGASWVDEYGSPEVAEERAFLETISPYHNFDPDLDYPTPLFLTSTKDDRVHPGHARKMAKVFEAAGKPFYYYENIDGGHSAAANRTELARRQALQFTYLQRQLIGPAGETGGEEDMD